MPGSQWVTPGSTKRPRPSKSYRCEYNWHISVTNPTPSLAQLSGRELLVLQLFARGYARGKVAVLLAMVASELEEVERSACAALGVATVEEAVELARHRRLIL